MRFQFPVADAKKSPARLASRGMDNERVVPSTRTNRPARSACERTRPGIMREEFATVTAFSSYVSGRVYERA